MEVGLKKEASQRAAQFVLVMKVLNELQNLLRILLIVVGRPD